MANTPFWCSIRVCTALPYRGEQILSLLTWVQIAKDCSMALLVLGVLAVLISGLGHLPWLFRLGGVLPLAAGAFAWVAGAHIEDTFGLLVQLEGDFDGTGPATVYTRLEREISATLQSALALGWVVVVVAIVLSLACALVLWRGFVTRKPDKVDRVDLDSVPLTVGSSTRR